jgi:hypothetical protein
VCAGGLGPVVPSGLTEGQQARRVTLLFDVADAVYVVEGVPGMTKVVLSNPCGRRAQHAPAARRASLTRRPATWTSSCVAPL